MSIPFSAKQFEEPEARGLRRVKIRLDKTVPTQTTWDQRKVNDIAKKGPKKLGVEPVVGAAQGRYFVMDGHHRIAAAIQRGDTHMWVRRAP